MNLTLEKTVHHASKPRNSMKFTYPPESRPLDGYTIKRAIHRGGFGEVYYALSDAGKEVALKLLQQNLEIELRGVRQCMNLKHPNLVTIFDIRTDGDGDHWIVMEYVHGKSLDRLIDDANGPMPMDEVGKLLTGMVSGLSFLHDRGIVHRDLKPANVFQENGVVKIGDVGLAKFITQSKRSAQTESVGTVYYMAPEVARGRYGHEVDIYSLGVMLYELLTGRVPFDGESTAEILMKHLSDRPDLSPIPKRLRPVLANVLEKDPLKRTPSADQLLAEFKKAVAGVEIPTTIPSDSFQPVPVPVPPVTVVEESEDRSWNQQPGVIDRKAERRARIEARIAAREARRKQRQRRRNVRTNGRPVSGATPANPSQNQTPAHTQNQSDSSERRAHWLKVGAIAVIAMAFIMPTSFPGLVRGLLRTSLLLIPGYLIYLFFFKNRVAASPAGQTPRMIPVHDRDRPKRPLPETYVPSPGKPKRLARVSPFALVPETVRAIPLRSRMTDMMGSLVFAIVGTAAITAVVAILSPAMQSAARIALFATGTLIASWAVLITAKTSEGTNIRGGHRRFAQLIAGCLVGVVAFAVHQFLFVQFQAADSVHPAGVVHTIGSVSLVDSFQPTLAGYVLFFGGLFLLRHWWRHADSLRSRRIAITSVMLTTLVGLVLSLLTAFPLMWGVTWAAAISSVVQLSAVWFSREERRQLTEAAHHV